MFVMAGAKTTGVYEEHNISSHVSVITVPTSQRYGNIWKITQLAYVHIFRQYLGTFDWLVRCDDDSYLIMENLRLFVYDRNVSDPFYYGLKLQQPPTGEIYNTGGPGYMMSHQNFKKLIQSFDFDGCQTEKRTSAEDVEVANCFLLVNLKR